MYAVNCFLIPTSLHISIHCNFNLVACCFLGFVSFNSLFLVHVFFVRVNVANVVDSVDVVVVVVVVVVEEYFQAPSPLYPPRRSTHYLK